MSFSETLKVRVTPEQKQRYEASALRAGLSPSEWVRQRLASEEQIERELASLREALAATIPARMHSAKAASVDTKPALDVETVLLLRAIAGASVVRMVHAELSRTGIEPWSSHG